MATRVRIKRFDYDLLDDEIVIRIGGRDKQNAEGKQIDLFTEKQFNIEGSEIIEFSRMLQNAAFDWSKKFNHKLDEGGCH